MSCVKDLTDASDTSINEASADAASAAEADEDVSQTATNSKSFEKYAPVIAQFKVCIIQRTVTVFSL